MPESSYTLLQLNTIIRETVKESFREALWVIAEINEMNQNSAGHCYLELIEKDPDSEQIIARARATIWFMTWRMLKPYFETATGQELQPGIKVMVRASVEFHELYGFSLNIKDIDPIYTLGDLEKKKAEIIRKLENEGIFDMNRNLDLELIPQRIAVISSPTAAGFQDFMHQIESNPYGYKFIIKLFPAIMQGKQAEHSILEALDQINTLAHLFDAVVLIRGGGSKADLNCFNAYLVASHIAQFPLPVITGIGHERDTTIVDMVAHTKMKTPTAVAEFLISKLGNFEAGLLDYERNLGDLTSSIITCQKHSLISLLNKVYPSFKNKINTEVNKTIHIGSGITGQVKNYFLKKQFFINLLENGQKYTTKKILRYKHERNYRDVASLLKITEKFVANYRQRLEFKENIVHLHDPGNILRKGFAIVTHNGKIVKSVKSLKKTDIIETKFKDGRIDSIVEKIYSS